MGRLALLVLGGGLPFGLVVLAGVQWAPAAHMGIFMAGCMPLFVNLGGRLVLGERLGGARALGLLLMALGVGALGLGVWRGGLASWRGDVLFVLAALLWAMYTLAFRGCGLSAWQGAALALVVPGIVLASGAVTVPVFRAPPRACPLPPTARARRPRRG